MNPLPSTLMTKFVDNQAVFTNSTEAKNAEAMLRQAQIPYQTKIRKHKKRSAEFVVTLLMPATND